MFPVFGPFRDEDERRAEEEKARARVKELEAQGFHPTTSKPPPPQPSPQHQRPPAEHNPPPTSHPPPSLQQSRLISQYKVTSTSKARERAAAEAQRMREPMVSTGEPGLFDCTIGLRCKARLIGSYKNFCESKHLLLFGLYLLYATLEYFSSAKYFPSV